MHFFNLMFVIHLTLKKKKTKIAQTPATGNWFNHCVMQTNLWIICYFYLTMCGRESIVLAWNFWNGDLNGFTDLEVRWIQIPHF